MPRVKKQRRKSSSAAVYVPVGILVIIILTLLGLSSFLRVTEISVTGATIYSVEEIILASGFSKGDNLLFLNTGDAQYSIQAVLPYISEVSIETSFPDKIFITVSESKSMATIRHRTGLLVLDSGARVVEIIPADEQPPSGLIEIRGFTPASADLGSRLRADLSNETQLSYLLDMLAAVEREELESKLTYIDVSSITNITFDYTDRFRVILDSPTNIRQNMSLLSPAMVRHEEQLAPGDFATIYREDSTGSWRMNIER